MACFCFVSMKIVFDGKVKAMERVALADQYFLLIKSGQKTTTVRYGKRNYKIGCCEFYSDNYNAQVNVEKVEYKQFKELNESDALTDGFSCLDELKGALKGFYPNVKDDDVVTKVTFRA